MNGELAHHRKRHINYRNLYLHDKYEVELSTKGHRTLLPCTRIHDRVPLADGVSFQ